MTLWKPECIWLCSQFLWLKRKVLVKKKKSQSFSRIFWQDNLKTHSRYIWTAQGFGANSTSHWMKGTFWLAATDSYTLFLSGWQIWPWHSSKCWRILALLSCDVLFLHCTKFVFFNPRSDQLTFASYCCGEMLWDRSKHLLACHPAVKFNSSGEKINYSLNFVIFVYFRLLHNLEPFCNHRTPPPH